MQGDFSGMVKGEQRGTAVNLIIIQYQFRHII